MGDFWESWTRFVYDARILSDVKWEMKTTGPQAGWPCDGRYRSRIAYPHRPATTHEEAFFPGRVCLPQHVQTALPQ
jgi:hypothetical protein